MFVFEHLRVVCFMPFLIRRLIGVRLQRGRVMSLALFEGFGAKVGFRVGC